MRILFITSTHNCMSQRAYVELTDRGHQVQVHLANGSEGMMESAESYCPDLIVAPMLKTAIPEEVWRKYPCFIIHPGIKGDRGPSSLDWAVLEGRTVWGVTVLEASAEMDAGDIWASVNFPMRPGSKSNLYRHETVDSAMIAMLLAIKRFEEGNFIPEPLDYSRADVHGRLHSPLKQSDRYLDWSWSTERIASVIRAADSHPGVLDEIDGEKFALFGVHEEDVLHGRPGTILAQRDGAICRATGDGAFWITHLKRKNMRKHSYFKLPAALVLGDKLANVPEYPLAVDASYPGRTFREIRYEERGEVGFLHFDFYNGAMSTEQCRRLLAAFRLAQKRGPKVLVLMGGRDFWSNGIHLNIIEAAENPADESWENINAMNDLVEAIITEEERVVISALQGNAGAGGAILALAADFVYARSGIVWNPHYKGMGGLYGSEYWTYLLPRRVGKHKAAELMEQLRPIGTRTALAIGMIDEHFGSGAADFRRQVEDRAARLAASGEVMTLLARKRLARLHDESVKPLDAYRREELEEMYLNFYSPQSQYHEARRRFVYKLSCLTSPLSELIRS